MSNERREELQRQMLIALWQDLKPHAERDAVILVAPDVDLVIAAEKVADDEVKTVQSWIQSRRFTRPSPEQLESWNNTQGKSFRFVIVQPYVLIQEVGH